MSYRTNQTTIIKKCIDSYLDKGLTNKQEIYSKVVEELGVPRPTVRRCAKELKNDMILKVKILQSEIPKPSDSNSPDYYLCKHGVNLIKFNCRDCDVEIEASKLVRSGKFD